MLRDGFLEALRLLTDAEPLILNAAGRSIAISFLAVAIAAFFALPAAFILARVRLPGRRIILALLRAGMSLPTVLVGLGVFALLSRRGPLGQLELLFTPEAIVIGEVLLAGPIIATLAHGALASLDPRVAETARTLGAGPVRRLLTELGEARTGIALAILTALGRCLTELGIAMMVGGNIRGSTRTLSTAIALETSRGELERGLAMGLVLLAFGLPLAALLALLNSDEGPGA